MPLTAEQKAAVETLKSVAVEDVDEAADALKESAHSLYQRVFNAGHTTAASKAKGEKGTLQQQLDAEKERATALQTELDELKSKTPDRAQIDAQWQQKLDRETKKVQDQLEAAQQRIARLTTDTVGEKTENALLAAGFRPRIAKLLAKEHAARIRFNDKGEPELLEAGSDIPVQIPAGKTAFQVLAEQEKATADPADLASGADTGGGARGGGGGQPGVTPEKIEQEKRASGAYTF